jgi:N-acetylmuramoyl-L-alanine amidase
VPLHAQDAVRAAAVPVETLFADASAKEAAVRKALGVREPNATVLRAVRTVVGDYENVVRLFPTSGFSDDALWRAGMLAREAFEEFGEARERSNALRLLKFLASQYPASRFAKQVAAQVDWLDAHPAKSTASAAASGPPASPAPASGIAAATGATSAAAPLVSIKDIRRAVLTDVVRVVIELDGEVTFHDERLENPARVFVDLAGTRFDSDLVDHTLRFDGDRDLVRQIRIGRHPNATTRVVLEAAGVSSYSVYPLYSPFRLVIDCPREKPAVITTDRTPAPAAPPAVAPPAARATRVAVLPPPVAPPPTAANGDTGTAPLPNAPATTVAAAETVAGPAVAVGHPPPAVPTPLIARRVRWVLPLPSLLALTLGDAAVEAAAGTKPPVLPAKPAPKATPPRPSAEPSQNLAGGLSIARQLGLGVSRIVIDPGHGGHDPGAKSGSMTEAEIVLDVALRLEKLLAKVPGVEVVLTRRDDQFITLQERTAIANRENADLFLSIHANASNAASARGIETYFLNFASNGNAAAVAARENATSQQTMGALQDVVKAIALNTKVNESRDFATYVQREMLKGVRPANKTVKDLGVKQAPFVVLIGASMPSVLAEISFITNPQEAKLLKGSAFRQRVAQSLYEGIREYQGSLKRSATVAQQQN